jgi:hypothetical protein
MQIVATVRVIPDRRVLTLYSRDYKMIVTAVQD